MPNVHTVKKGETYYIDGEIHCSVHGTYMDWVVVIPSPPVTGTYSELAWDPGPTAKRALVSMMLVHPDKLRTKKKDPNAPSC